MEGFDNYCPWWKWHFPLDVARFEHCLWLSRILLHLALGVPIGAGGLGAGGLGAGGLGAGGLGAGGLGADGLEDAEELVYCEGVECGSLLGGWSSSRISSTRESDTLSTRLGSDITITVVDMISS